MIAPTLRNDTLAAQILNELHIMSRMINEAVETIRGVAGLNSKGFANVGLGQRQGAGCGVGDNHTVG